MLEQPKHPAKKSAPVAGLEGLSEREWGELYLRLSLYAQAQHNKFSRTPLEPGDFVQGAIEAWYTGRRKKPKDVDLFSFLARVIDSKIAHESAKQVRIISIDPEYEEVSTPPPAVPVFLRKEIQKLVAGDKVLSDIVSLLLEDPSLTPRHLTTMLGLRPSEIYNAMKRLRRKLSQLRSQETNPRAQGA